MKILAIESSCDETAAAVVNDGVKIISNMIASSHEMHEKYGGIVPEVAARKQLEYIIPTINEALFSNKQAHSRTESSIIRTVEQISHQMDQIDAIAVTIGPGLIGSLLVGVETAKTIAVLLHKPLIPVNHVLAHMYANFVNDKQSNKVTIHFPAISLVVSGGHTELFLMTSPQELRWLGGTLDDAAGEAFDKTARLIGFGNEGGPAVQNAASKYRVSSAENRVKLPRPMLDKNNELNFSFSGLKTAIWRAWNTYTEHSDDLVNGFAHEVQESITDVLVKKTLRAVEKFDAQSILLSGGVAANLRLREKFTSMLDARNSRISLCAPPISLCTDNAVYIASYAFFRGEPQPWDAVTAVPDLSVEEI